MTAHCSSSAMTLIFFGKSALDAAFRSENRKKVDDERFLNCGFRPGSGSPL
jgi:hypothetical protein